MRLLISLAAIVLAAAASAGAAATKATASPQPPVLEGTWAINGTVTANSDATGFLGPAYNVGAVVPRTWRFEQACAGDPLACETDLIRVTDVGEARTRIGYQGDNQFAWVETLVSGGTCGPQQFTAGTIRAEFSMIVTAVPIPTGRPYATSLVAVGNFVFTIDQAAYVNAGCSAPPAQISYTVRYTGTAPTPPPPTGGTEVFGGPATGLEAGNVKLPGATGFSPITPGQNLPPGTVLDVSGGKGVSLADPRGRIAVFFGEKDGAPSQFVMAGVVSGFVELRLTGGSFASCKKTARVRTTAKVEKPVRRLWGKGKGKFRTKGRYATAAVRGTWWLTADYCSRTQITVKQGSVTVGDLVKKKTVVVKAPKSYSALPKKR